MKCQINLDIYNPEAPAFWPAAPLRRTSVFAASENLAQGGFTPPEHVKSSR